MIKGMILLIIGIMLVIAGICINAVSWVFTIPYIGLGSVLFYVIGGALILVALLMIFIFKK